MASRLRKLLPHRDGRGPKDRSGGRVAAARAVLGRARRLARRETLRRLRPPVPPPVRVPLPHRRPPPRPVGDEPDVVVEVKYVEEIVAILRDRERYPNPVRAVGSNRAATPCGAAAGGTRMSMRHMDRIVDIGEDRVTAQAGALYRDVAAALRARGLQFHVDHGALGDLTMGAAASTGAMDASMPGELGQVASHCTSLRMVTPAGELVEVTEADGELMQAARCGHGLLGVVHEVTFSVRPLAPVRVRHERHDLDRLAEELPGLLAGNESVRLSFGPFTDGVQLELRSHQDQPAGRELPRLGPRGRAAPASGTWAFPEETYADVVRTFVEFARDHHRRTGFRASQPAAGRRIAEDRGSLLSCSFDGHAVTCEAMSDGGEGWDDFLRAYNELCSGLGGVPFLDQTPLLTRDQVARAFGDRLVRFETHRRRFDPADRLLNAYFRELLAPPADA